MMEHNDAAATLRFVQIGCAEQHSHTLIGDQMAHDFPQLAS